MEETVSALALQMVPDLGPVTAKKLIDHFGSPSAVFSAGIEDLNVAEGLGSKRAESIKGYCGWERAEEIVQICESRDIFIAHYGSEHYPELLMQISDPPTVIYYRGRLSPNDKYSIAIVGSRSLTSYGRNVAQTLSEGLASLGLTVVSGMARGIDSIAHVGAIKKNGRTIAVLGSGVDVIYPSENTGLYRKIQEAGAVISEFPLGEQPRKEHFPQRNRIISGMSLGVIVVEASKASGTLITARYALDQGRDVFAVPGSIYSVNSFGTNELLKRGAKPVSSPDDVLTELGHVLKGFIKADRNVKVEITHDERHLCDMLSFEPMHVDDITRNTGMSSSRVLGLLLGLELKSIVRQAEGKKFCLVREVHNV